jgi:hypothetical protein
MMAITRTILNLLSRRRVLGRSSPTREAVGIFRTGLQDGLNIKSKRSEVKKDPEGKDNLSRKEQRCFCGRVDKRGGGIKGRNPYHRSCIQ